MAKDQERWVEVTVYKVTYKVWHHDVLEREKTTNIAFSETNQFLAATEVRTGLPDKRIEIMNIEYICTLDEHLDDMPF